MSIEAGPVPAKLELSAEDYAKREADRQLHAKIGYIKLIIYPRKLQDKL